MLADLRTKPWLIVSSGGVRSHREDRVGAVAVQIVWSSRRGSRSIEHRGQKLKAAARQRLAAGQIELGLGPGGPGPSGPLEIASSRMGHLCDAPCRAYDVLGFPGATGHDEFVRTARRYRTIQIRADRHTLTADDPLPPSSHPTYETPSPSSSNPISAH